MDVTWSFFLSVSSRSTQRRLLDLYRPQIRRDYPLNLSISISGGKETNQDSPSNGERTGNSSILNLGRLRPRIVVSRNVIPMRTAGLSCLEQHIGEGENPVFGRWFRGTRRFPRVGLFGLQPKRRGKPHVKLNIGTRPIANKYHEGKMKSTLKES